MAIAETRLIGEVHTNGHKSGELIKNSVPLIVPLEAESPREVGLVGRKAASLAKLRSIPGINVPESFVVTTASANRILQDPEIQRRTGLLGALSAEWIEAKLGREKTGSLESQIRAEGSRIRDQIEAMGLPDSIKMEIAERCEELCRKTSEPSVAVRSSAVAQDGLGSSFTGELGEEHVVNAVVKCFASQFSETAITKINEDKLGIARRALLEGMDSNQEIEARDTSSHGRPQLAVMVQEMIFTQGGFGLSVGHNGSSFVRLNVGFDSWDVDTSGTIKYRRITNKKRGTLFNGNGVGDIPLSDEEVAKVANDVFAIREAFGREVHVEFMPRKGNILFVQAKPV